MAVVGSREALSLDARGDTLSRSPSHQVSGIAEQCSSNDVKSLDETSSYSRLIQSSDLPSQGAGVWLLQAFCLAVYLVTWVANGEFLQGIANGMLCPGKIPYDKPAFLSWFDNNYLILCVLIVYPYARYYRKWTFWSYTTKVWAGQIGWQRAFGACAAISYTLLILNILFVVGLECISVGLSNAIYQLQTVFTLALSVLVLKDRFIFVEAAGVLASFLGVACIVIPPLVYKYNGASGEGDRNESQQACSFQSGTLIGAFATLTSAAILGVYQVSWRLLSESKDDVPLNRLEGFMDTLMTLTAIGVCNLVVGWPMLFALHWLGIETFQLPPSSHLGILSANALVEYAFDTSFAVAICMTSPVVTAITAPLVIPLSLIADHAIYGSPTTSGGGVWGWMGVCLILIGVAVLVTKPDMTKYCKKRRDRENSDLMETEMRSTSYVSINSIT